jgi:hypothetical protein
MRCTWTRCARGCWVDCDRGDEAVTLDALVDSSIGLIAALIGVSALMFGWKVTHRQELQRDLAAKRRELRIQYLIEAYRRLENVSNRHPLTPKTAPDFERAIADIQLFGSVDQVALAQEFARDFAKNGAAPLDPLLSNLRRSLRGEIGLEAVGRELTYLRMTFDESGKTTLGEGHGERRA